MTPQLPVNAPPIFNVTIETLTRDFIQYQQSGIYDDDRMSWDIIFAANNDDRNAAIRNYHKILRDTPLLHNAATRRFFRHCAKEMKRPFVFTRQWQTYEQVGGRWKPGKIGRYFYFPRQKRLDPLYAPLFLLSKKDAHGGGRVGVTNHRVGYRVLEFWVTEDDGANEFYQHMIERIRTNPTFRSIFKIPEEV